MIMTHTFQIQEAKNRFSEVVDLCLREGPQIVTRHGKPVVQIMPFTNPRSASHVAEKKTVPSSFLSLRGSGKKLWDSGASRAVERLRNEWD
jgi:prevent-host-death family protein